MENIHETIRVRLEGIIYRLEREIDNYIYKSVSGIGYNDISVHTCKYELDRLRSHITESVFPIADEEIEQLINFVLGFIKEYGNSEDLISNQSLLSCHISFRDNLLDSDEQRLKEVLATPWLYRIVRKDEYIENYKACFANVARHQARQLLFEYFSTQIKQKEQELLSKVVRKTYCDSRGGSLLAQPVLACGCTPGILGGLMYMFKGVSSKGGGYGSCMNKSEDVFCEDVQNASETCVMCTPESSDKRAVPDVGNDKEVYDRVYSSVFAPAEVKKKSHLLTQIYLHLYEDSEKVISLSQKADRNSERRDYVPLSVNIKRGAKVDVEFCIYGETKLMDKRVSSIWQGDFLKFSFDYFVPQNIDVEELCCEAIVFVEGMMIGEMRFITQIVESPKVVAPKVVSHCFKRIFISYAHKDEQQVKFIAAAYKAQGVDYFYDSHYLAPSDVYEEKIFDYIDNADLFVLCWSKNAADSEYVSREVERALQHAYPQVCKENATIKIYPLNIEPYADLPDNILKVYHYGFV